MLAVTLIPLVLVRTAKKLTILPVEYASGDHADEVVLQRSVQHSRPLSLHQRQQPLRLAWLAGSGCPGLRLNQPGQQAELVELARFHQPSAALRLELAQNLSDQKE